MLINTVTASVLIKAGHNSLKPPITPPVYILQNAAASGVGRLLTQVALDRGVRPIRLVRSNESAERLRSALPDRKSTRLNSSHQIISYAVFCLKKKKQLRAAYEGRH